MPASQLASLPYFPARNTVFVPFALPNEEVVVGVTCKHIHISITCKHTTTVSMPG